MAIAPRQPHRSWYRQFWYAEQSPRDTLTDRALFFAIVALGLVAGGMSLVRHYAVPHAAGHMSLTMLDRSAQPGACGL